MYPSSLVAAFFCLACALATRGAPRAPPVGASKPRIVSGKAQKKKEGSVMNKVDISNGTSLGPIAATPSNRTRDVGSAPSGEGDAAPAASRGQVPVFGKPLAIIDVTGFTSDGEGGVQENGNKSTHSCRGASLLNSLMGTNFSASDAGSFLVDSASNVPILYAYFDAMYSASELAGSRAIDAASLISDNACILMNPNTSLTLIDPVVRRLATNLMLKGGNATMIVLVDLTGTNDQKQIAGLLRGEIETFLKTIISEQKMGHGISVSEEGARHNFTTLVFPISLQSPSASRQVLLALLRSQLRDAANRLRVSSVDEVSKEALLTLRRLQVLSPASSKPLLTEVQELDEMKLNDKFLAALFEFRITIRRLEDRLFRGKLVHGLGARADVVASRVVRGFAKDTEALKSIGARMDKVNALNEVISSALHDLREMQMQLLEREAHESVKRFMKAKLAKSGSFPANLSQCVNLAMDEYSAKLSDAIPSFISEDKNEFVKGFEERLLSFCMSFPDSAEARTLLAVVEQQRVERGLHGGPSTPEEVAEDAALAVARPERRRRRIKMGLGLVGMIRPPGLGNIQGYFGYSLAALGMPINLLFGFQNSGDEFDVPPEAVEVPLLKLQPKLHFDIDL